MFVSRSTDHNWTQVYIEHLLERDVFDVADWLENNGEFYSREESLAKADEIIADLEHIRNNYDFSK